MVQVNNDNTDFVLIQEIKRYVIQINNLDILKEDMDIKVIGNSGVIHIDEETFNKLATKYNWRWEK